MALTEVEQIKKLLDDSQYWLIVFPPHDTGDFFASALALKHLAATRGKQADIVSSGWSAPHNLKFLPGADSARPQLTEVQKFIIKVDVSKAPIETLSYDVADGWLSIYLTPKTGSITKNELRTAQSNFKYDAVITLGAPDLTSLGDVYLNNTDLFFRLPVINIDRSASNERFGQINYLDLTTSAVSEVTTKLLKNIAEHEIAGDVATTLLAGMTIATKSFTSREVTPHTLRVASELVERGADREKIVTHLYRTRSVPALKLWGAALSRLNHDRETGLMHTSLTREDFSRCGARADAVNGIIEELLSNAPEAKVITLLYEVPNQAQMINGIVATSKEHNAQNLTKALNPTGTPELAHITILGKTLGEAENEILTHVRSQLK
jgi:nanoRNase/pAp phosphatase (c-di-AMP/oligoRNAs hydrolase)